MSRAPHRRRRVRGEATPPSARRIAAGLDGGVLMTTALLSAFGLVMIYSATSPFALEKPVSPHFVRHLVALVTAIAVAAAATRIPLRVFRSAALPLWLAGTLLLLATLTLGVSVNGARRWLEVPGLTLRFQPAEIVKWTTVLALAAVLCRRARTPRFGDVVLPGALAAIPAALLLLQPDLGNAVLLLASAALLLFVAGTPLRFFVTPALAGAAGLAAYVGLKPYALARWTGFLHPWETSQSSGFQLVQSFAAFGHGGLLGVGLGDSRQKLFYLPEAHTDFILSVVAEELGLCGVLVVLGTFAALLVAGTRIALRAREPFALLVAFGMTALLTLPAIVNAAVVTGMLPTKGLPLPFVSYGRTSLLICFAAVGMLLEIARRASRAVPPLAAANPRGGIRR